jgi:hypothetical protein
VRARPPLRREQRWTVRSGLVDEYVYACCCGCEWEVVVDAAHCDGGAPAVAFLPGHEDRGRERATNLYRGCLR